MKQVPSINQSSWTPVLSTLFGFIQKKLQRKIKSNEYILDFAKFPMQNALTSCGRFVLILPYCYV